MYAVIKTGGKQYKVSTGDKISVEKLKGDKGSKIVFDDVLLIGDGEKLVTGSPTIKGSSVHAEVLDQFKDDKIIVFKKKRRQNYRRKKGHRQNLTQIEIKEVKTTA
ncbi:MAG: 50S ribosomal protein L21 [Alphaproteobacteria bacterium]|nr:50S ribosomal protein L21 [Alphaproteobacteria bacterium]